VLGVFRTRRGALGFIAESKRTSLVAGPWANAARRSQAAQIVHRHEPVEESLDPLVHIHEFDELSHSHPGYGPGSVDEDDDDGESGPGGI
jgi:hypothetical protein